MDLKPLRLKYNLTQLELANVLGMEQQHISRWELGNADLNWLKFEGIKSILEKEYDR